MISCQNEKIMRQIFYMVQGTRKLSEIHKKVEKMLKEKLVIFALDPKLDWAKVPYPRK